MTPTPTTTSASPYVAQGEVGEGEFRVEVDGRGVLGDGTLQIPCGGKGVAQADVRVGVRGVEIDSRAVLGDDVASRCSQ
jgi:hypothetical protein